MLALLQDSQIQKIINPPHTPSHWESDLKRLEAGDLTLNRHSAGENSIKALQRLLIFLGYSTSSGGSFSIDGDFGRGTNRALAQFQFDQGIPGSVVGSFKEMFKFCFCWLQEAPYGGNGRIGQFGNLFKHF